MFEVFPGKMASEVLTHSQRVLRLYRSSLRHMLSWIIDRQAWRVEAVKLRARFDANKGIRDMRLATKLLEDGEAEFNALKHPDPYIAPTEPDGSKWERNMPPPPHVLEMTPEEKEWLSEWIEHHKRYAR